MILAKTEAAGERALLPEVLAFTSSLPLDRQLLREDLAGSLAHLAMLSRCGIVPREAALALRDELVKLWDADPAQLPAEEDVHMAVEARLTAALGDTAGMETAVRKVVRDLDPTIPIRESSEWKSQLAMNFFPSRVATIALGLFGFVLNRRACCFLLHLSVQAAALNHKAIDHTMKNGAVIKTAFGIV